MEIQKVIVANMNYKVTNILFLSVFIVLIAVMVFVDLSYFYLIASLILYLGIITWGVVDIRLNFFLPSIQKLENKKQVLLTFDDGPHPVYTPLILDLLDEFNAKAIFFVIGEQVGKSPLLIEEIQSRGHIIGCHTWSHHYLFDIFSVNKMIEEVTKTNQLLEQLTGEKPEYFRPPFGITNPRIAKLVKKTGMKSVAWSFRSFDGSKRKNDTILNAIKKNVNGGEILLFHDNRLRTVELLKLALPILYESYSLDSNDL